MGIDFVVPYGPRNASVRARALRWVQRSAPQPNREPAFFGPGFDRGQPASGSTVVLVRNARRISRGGIERRLLSAAALGVYDIDDGLPWDNGALPGLGRPWKRLWPRSRIATAAATAADRVIAGNDILAEWASEHCADVRVIPTCVEPDDYERKTSYALSSAPSLGWLGSPATEPYLFAIAPSLVELHRRTGAVLEVVSQSGVLPAALRPFTTRVPWSEEVGLTRPAVWDVGLMPLPDDVYSRAKCGYKLLQYWCAGLPAVGSPVGVNSALLASAGACAPERIDEWVDAVESVLSADDGERAAMGARGREVAAAYSYDVWQQRWSDAVGWVTP